MYAYIHTRHTFVHIHTHAWTYIHIIYAYTHARGIKLSLVSESLTAPHSSESIPSGTPTVTFDPERLHM